ncbi:helix-turn-helix transcriptional regulator [Enterococcus rivorum]|uniref:Transcriptional regulator n=1 Tax=Enterococcus rivorum TaxID=762845 RepID=A0A1E5KYJ5_9ENTE|nr:YafY family protein [Enterococcus rivorum]MBP2097475.1 putative DNA-binding transcriptional regulator YafY [Enterococcus rivorum]OEH82935.1 hypothetical protein BCR26_01275 [Enterococcus rivorum]
MNSLSRLFYIVYFLSLNKQAKATELAEKLEVSTRTIYRDIDTLSGLGFPVYSQNGRGGGLRLLDNHHVPSTFVSGEEQDQILIALQNLAATNLKEASPLVNKMSSLFNKSPEPLMAIDFSSWGREEESIAIKVITKAKIASKCVRFSYTNSKNEQTIREVMPNKLFFKKNAWYLVGYCCLKKSTRLFKLKRITEVVISERMLDETLLVKEYQPNYAYIYVEFIVKDSLYQRLREELRGIEETELIGDGMIKVKTLQPEGDWLIHYLLSFGSTIEVLHPKEIREEIKKELTKLNQLYF